MSWIAALLVGLGLSIAVGSIPAELVLFDVPARFEIEWLCLPSTSTRAAGYYAGAFAGTGILSWFALVVGTKLYRRKRRRTAVILPLAWLATILFASLVAASLIGPRPGTAGVFGVRVSGYGRSVGLEPSGDMNG